MGYLQDKNAPYFGAKSSQQFPWYRRPGVETRGKYVRVRMTRLMGHAI